MEKVYDFSSFKPKFVTKIQDYFRSIRLKIYKKKKVNQSKTPHQRYYHIKYKIGVDDDHNPQLSEATYETLVPARAAFFAKIMLERSVIKKIHVDIVDWEELTEEEHEEFLKSKEEYVDKIRQNNEAAASIKN